MKSLFIFLFNNKRTMVKHGNGRQVKLGLPIRETLGNSSSHEEWIKYIFLKGLAAP
jgi:hypothetical protein